ncbi:hypothetical protein L596_005003 [Steinernema carpocapsae]|uniref:E3 UFM1-protein ligase 1 homolog n=1 Tax=Steinernema carpocapsae TaxID=34508 RepID=A0A4U8UYN8_STECR|nr:hypothetical protein L596_005003 [Steinernema carpocapsae]
MTTWSDIKKLAADLQRVQLSEGAKKLSENNCIEVVHKLITANMLQLFFTTDGREYVTKKHLLTEIRNESLAHDGRAPIGDIASALRVEFGQIESLIAEIVAEDEDFFVCNGELISREYIRKLCVEVEERLQEAGSLSLQHLTKNMRVPTEVLNHHILPSVGSVIDAVQYGDMLYTSTYLRTQRSALSAILTALTRVTPLSRIQQHLNVSSSLFSSLWDELKELDALPGSIVGNKSSSNALYVPWIHERMVKEYTINVFHETQVIDFSTLKKLFTSDPSAYLKQVFSKEDLKKNLIVFPSCAISTELWQEIEKTVAEEMEKSDYCDISQMVPSNVPFHQGDLDTASQLLLKNSKDWRITDSGLCYDTNIIGKVVADLDEFVADRAELLAPDYVKQMRQQQNQKSKADSKKNMDEDDDWDTGAGKKKKGGKQKGGGGKQSKAADQSQSKQQAVSVSIPNAEVEEEMRAKCNLPEELVDEIGDEIRRQVDQLFREKVESALLSLHQSAAQNQKKALQSLQERVMKLYANIHMFEQGALAFDEASCLALKQHLLRTLCLDFSNGVLEYLSGVPDVAELSQKKRQEVIKELPSTDLSNCVNELFASADLETFYDLAQKACSFRLRTPDKKQLEDLQAAFIADLRTQLESAQDAPTSFLLIILLYLSTRLNVSVHASGKFVRDFLNHIEKVEEANADVVKLFHSCQKLVVESLKKNTGALDELQEQIGELKQRIA